MSRFYLFTRFLFSCKVWVVVAGSLVIAGLFVQGRPRKHHQIRILKFHSKTSVINDPPFIASDTGTFLRLCLRMCLSLRLCLRLSPCLRPSLLLRLHQRLCLCLCLLVLLSSAQLQQLLVWNDDTCQTIIHKNFLLCFHKFSAAT